MRVPLSILLVLLTAMTAIAADSEWIHIDSDGKLHYKTSERGDRIMDFSTVGYAGGGVDLPDVPVVKTVAPSGGEDDSASIQATIEQVEATSVKNVFRGAILLKPGVYNCTKPIAIKGSGVVLRGSDGTTLKLLGRHVAISVGAKDAARPTGKWVSMADYTFLRARRSFTSATLQAFPGTIRF